MTAILWTCAIALALIAAVLTSWLVPAIREVLEDRRADRAEPRDDLDITDEIKAIEPAKDLAVVLVAPSPLVPTRQLNRKRTSNEARLDQQARHAAVVAATNAGPLHVRPQRARPQLATPPGPLTTEFNAIVARNTGTAPKGRGPREADLRAWQQLDLFAEVG